MYYDDSYIIRMNGCQVFNSEEEAFNKFHGYIPLLMMMMTMRIMTMRIMMMRMMWIIRMIIVIIVMTNDVVMLLIVMMTLMYGYDDYDIFRFWCMNDNKVFDHDNHLVIVVKQLIILWKIYMYVKSSNRYENSFYFILAMQHSTYLIDIEISEIFRLFFNSKKRKEILI